MKYIFSGYGEIGLTFKLYEFHEETEYCQELDGLRLFSPSFVHYCDDIIYTFHKEEGIILDTYQVINHQIVSIDQKRIPISNITHFLYSPKNKLFIGCSYQEGIFFSISVLMGKFQDDLQIREQKEEGMLSRCHCVLMNPEESIVGIVNIALDTIYFYSISSMGLNDMSKFTFPKGSGPRHAIYHQDGSIIYVISEYSNEIFVIDVNRNQLLQTISTLKDKFIVSYGATLVIVGNRLYASNRGEDSIAVFEIKRSGLLEYIESFSCFGKHPRHMIATSNQKYIISCNKDSNEICFIHLKDKTAKIKIPFLEPSGVIELK